MTLHAKEDWRPGELGRRSPSTTLVLLILESCRANQIQNIKIARDVKKIAVETIEDAVPKETHTGIEVTTKAAAALKAAVDTEASVDIYTKGHYYY